MKTLNDSGGTNNLKYGWRVANCLFSGGNLIEDGEPLVHAAYNAWVQRNFVYNNGAWPDLLRFGYNARWGYYQNGCTVVRPKQDE